MACKIVIKCLCKSVIRLVCNDGLLDLKACIAAEYRVKFVSSNHEICLGDSPPQLQFTIRRTNRCYVAGTVDGQSQSGTVIYGNAHFVVLAYNFTNRALHVGMLICLNISVHWYSSYSPVPFCRHYYSAIAFVQTLFIVVFPLRAKARFVFLRKPPILTTLDNICLRQP